MLRLLVLVVFASILCQAGAAPVPKGPKPPWRLPTQPGTTWVYAQSGDHDAVVTASITDRKHDAELTEMITNAKAQDGHFTIVIRYESEWTANGMKRGAVHSVTRWVNGEGLFETPGVLSLDPDPVFMLLKLPSKAGDVWERKHRNEAVTRTVGQAVQEEGIKVPAGTFDCVRVETKAYKDEQLLWVRSDWYASGIGLVKSTGGPNEKRVWVLKQFSLGKDRK